MRLIPYTRLIAVLVIQGCLALAVLVRAQTSYIEESYETAITLLTADTDSQHVRDAVALLVNAGTKAFPTLLTHLNEKAKASDYFQREEGHLDAGGNFVLRQPTIGDACFDLIQSQVEGDWPKGYRRYYFLTPSNVVNWWQSRKERSLDQLRVEAARESLKKARNERGTRNFDPRSVRLFEEHLRKVLAGRVDDL